MKQISTLEELAIECYGIECPPDNEIPAIEDEEGRDKKTVWLEKATT